MTGLETQHPLLFEDSSLLSVKPLLSLLSIFSSLVFVNDGLLVQEGLLTMAVARTQNNFNVKKKKQIRYDA